MNGGQSRPILITGGKGSGKSTIARAIASRLEADKSLLCGKLPVLLMRCHSVNVSLAKGKERTDGDAEIVYEDVGRVNAEGRLSDLKATLQGWIDNAKARRPAVLILDGLDTLLCPENEVSPLHSLLFSARPFSWESLLIVSAHPIIPYYNPC